MGSPHHESISHWLRDGAPVAATLLAALILAAGCAEVRSDGNSSERLADQLYLASLFPPSAAVGTTSQTLTINGGGFLASSSVTFNGVYHETTFINPTKLSIQLAKKDLEDIGDFSVTVTNPPPGGPSVGSYFRVEGGTLELRVTGLPAGTEGSVSITSSNGFSAVVSSTQTLRVPPATYFVAANGFGTDELDYYSERAEQAVNVADGSSSSLQVHYTIRRPRMSFLSDQGAFTILSVPLSE
jgi:hypothetical protein